MRCANVHNSINTVTHVFLTALLFFNLNCDSVAASKTLRCMFPIAEAGFDPATAVDPYSTQVIQSIFETLYTFDYMARPVKLRPQTAEGMPEVSSDGKTYTIRLKKGIFFTSDLVFGKKNRELTMNDYIFSFLRLLDPKIHSPHAWLLAGKIKGTGTDLTKVPLEKHPTVTGLELVDRYTLRIHLNEADYNFGNILAYYPTSAVAQEVIEKYTDSTGDAAQYPVGTGPYQLSSWQRGARIVLVKNQKYRGFLWDFVAGKETEDQGIAKEMTGKKMPIIDRIEISILLEDTSRLLSFQRGEIDILQLSGALSQKLLPQGKLTPDLSKNGIQLSRTIDPEITFHYWNMRDQIVGGLEKEKIALRRAIAMAYDVNEEIKLLHNSEAITLDYPIPPNIAGHVPNYRKKIPHHIEAANRLLDKFSYKIGPDGWRTLPNGHPLKVAYSASTDTIGRSQAEFWKKTLKAIKINMHADLRTSSDLLKATRNCKLQMRTGSWSADYPDGDNFMQIFYGPNTGQGNSGCISIPEYDVLYDKTKKIIPGIERDRLYAKMARILELNTVIITAYSRYNIVLTQPKVIGYKKHPFLPTEWMYLDVDDSVTKTTMN